MKKEKWIIPYLKQYRGLFLLAIFLGGLTILFGGGLVFTSGYLISKAATRPESILMIYVPIVGVRTFGIGRAVLSYIERLTGHQFILKILSNMRVRLYKVLEPQATFLRSRFLTGDILGVLADDIEHLQDFYLKTLFPSLVSLIIYTVIMVCAGSFSISFALTLAILIGILLFIAPGISFYYLRAKNEKMKHGRHRLYQQFTDAVFGVSDWLFSGRQLEFIKQYEALQHQQLQIEKKIHSFVNWRDLGNQVLLGIMVIYAIYRADVMSVSGQIPATFIAAVGLVTLSILESFLPLSDAVSNITSYQDSIHRLEKLDSYDVPKWVETENDMDCDFPNISIELTDVRFQYPTEPILIHDLNLTVKQGEKIAILGPSGAGKSTLLKLILGELEPTNGSVLLNEYKANEIQLAIPKIISVLNQKAYLFHTSVLNNIRLGNPEASDEEVYKAAEQVQLHDMIKDLPKGYETNMNETGQRFSGGERHRIALARILLQKTPVVIMDEPTVGLDPITEKQLLATIFETLKDKTIIWVTHHLIGMEKMDRILFMDRGKVTMSGSHQQLLATEDRYRKLYSMDHPFFK
ncbi:thiol reductant ABC exporter subunit CydC [Bacillus sp. BRMEA1]|uniref:thiol reductant ABC exporter subunit CydC n=1 Tax=Neobacillus endophyticus TaxID=2738405 RepID=UPI001565EC83|nr:thiol reductant ABC exporter subunit CydC [Neobacillus endophyticus]NRD79198.1 thiol reductant ABC exporter subunit CydC [Neobacillus endophyticus]